MTEAVKKYAQEYAAEQSMIAVIMTKVATIKKMIEKKIPLGEALEMADLDMQTYEKYSAKDNSQFAE